MSSNFASKIRFHITKTEPCKVFLPNGESNMIECLLLDVLAILQRTQIIANLKFGQEVYTTSYSECCCLMMWTHRLLADMEKLLINFSTVNLSRSNVRQLNLKYLFICYTNEKVSEKETRSFCN